MVIKRAANPTSVAQGKGLFTHVVEVDNATVSKTVYISGQVAWNASGDVVGAGDLRAQFVQVYENLRSLVAHAGGTLADVVQLRTYLTSRELLPAFVAIRNDLYPTLFPNREYPTNTLLIVGGLVDPALLLEVEAVAVM